MKRLLLVTLAIATLAASCGGSGSDGAVSSSELAACEYAASVDWIEEPVNGVNLIFDSTVYSAGDFATFDWEIDEGIEVVVGDEWIVDCWDGQDPLIAWQANGVFNDEPTSVVTNEVLGGDDDGWDPTPGAVLIPASAPVGFYTVTAEGVPFGADGESLGASEFTASFLIVN